jgi:hypothetical protein
VVVAFILESYLRNYEENEKRHRGFLERWRVQVQGSLNQMEGADEHMDYHLSKRRSVADIQATMFGKQPHADLLVSLMVSVVLFDAACSPLSLSLSLDMYSRLVTPGQPAVGVGSSLNAGRPRRSASSLMPIPDLDDAGSYVHGFVLFHCVVGLIC